MWRHHPGGDILRPVAALWETRPQAIRDTETGQSGFVSISRRDTNSFLSISMVRRNPVMLHDDSLSDDLACVITDIGLMKGVGDVTTGRGEVCEVSNHHEVEVVIEVPRVIAARHGEHRRYGTHPIESLTKRLL